MKLVRGRISLSRNKRLRDVLSESGDPSQRLSEELPAAVMIEWMKDHPDGSPPASVKAIPPGEIGSLTNRVARRLERQADEGDKIIGALRRVPGYLNEDEAFEIEEKLRNITKLAGLTPRERDIYELLLHPDVEEAEMPYILDLEPESVTKTKYRMMKKLRKAAAEGGYSEKFK